MDSHELEWIYYCRIAGKGQEMNLEKGGRLATDMPPRAGYRTQFRRAYTSNAAVSGCEISTIGGPPGK